MSASFSVFAYQKVKQSQVKLFLIFFFYKNNFFALFCFARPNNGAQDYCKKNSSFFLDLPDWTGLFFPSVEWEIILVSDTPAFLVNFWVPWFQDAFIETRIKHICVSCAHGEGMAVWNVIL